MTFKHHMAKLKPLAYHATALAHRARAAAGFGQKHPSVGIVIERADWAIRWYGTFVAEGANAVAPGTAWVTTDPAVLTQGIVQFGSQYQWVDWSPYLSSRCRFVSTFFHGKPEDGPEVARHIDRFMGALPKLDKVICSASIVRDRLIAWGAPTEKLALIPIGCETQRFLPPTEEERAAARRRFGVPDGATVIGSFQKDGDGWAEGNAPKLIKGPDLFLAAVRRLKDATNVFVLLTGPARGFVKRGLEAMGVPFAHHFAETREDLAKCYHALDIYLVTSREEGGPMALMESMSSHVPVVSTSVGMAPDLIEDGVTGGLVETLDAEDIATRALVILGLPDGARAMKTAAREAVKVTDWSVVGRRQLEEVWQPLLDEDAAASRVS
jgi:glycosyltransferase involved in cell wall biosynthesis